MAFPKLGLARRTPVPMPPQELRFMNEDDERFVQRGDNTIADLREHAGLDKHSHIVDVGCGYGRVACALLRWGFKGDYLGFDILPKHIAWCRDNLTTKHTRFRHLDIQNDRYNRGGTLSSADVDLGLEPGWASVILATSVFTHMWPAEITHYLRQIRTALTPDGLAYLTFFLTDETWAEQVDAGVSQQYPLPRHTDEVYRVMNPDNPLHVIAFDDGWVRDQMSAAGLEVVSVMLGSWCGRTGEIFQDVLIVRPA